MISPLGCEGERNGLDTYLWAFILSQPGPRWAASRNGVMAFHNMPCCFPLRGQYSTIFLISVTAASHPRQLWALVCNFALLFMLHSILTLLWSGKVLVKRWKRRFRKNKNDIRVCDEDEEVRTFKPVEEDNE